MAKSHRTRELKLRHKILLCVILVLILLCMAGETDRGQQILSGKAPANETHFDEDDRYMGAALAPIVYCLIPAGILLIFGAAEFAVNGFKDES